MLGEDVRSQAHPERLMDWAEAQPVLRPGAARIAATALSLVMLVFGCFWIWLQLWDEAPLDPRLWIRDIFLTSKQDFGKIVVFGHTPLKRPIAMENKIGIDTGAAYGGKLTAAILNPAIRYDPADIDFIQV